MPSSGNENQQISKLFGEVVLGYSKAKNQVGATIQGL
jgi:hypothetical protein